MRHLAAKDFIVQIRGRANGENISSPSLLFPQQDFWKQNVWRNVITISF